MGREGGWELVDGSLLMGRKGGWELFEERDLELVGFEERGLGAF